MVWCMVWYLMGNGMDGNGNGNGQRDRIGSVEGPERPEVVLAPFHVRRQLRCRLCWQVNFSSTSKTKKCRTIGCSTLCAAIFRLTKISFFYVELLCFELLFVFGGGGNLCGWKVFEFFRSLQSSTQRSQDVIIIKAATFRVTAATSRFPTATSRSKMKMIIVIWTSIVSTLFTSASIIWSLFLAVERRLWLFLLPLELIFSLSTCACVCLLYLLFGFFSFCSY